MMMHLGVEQFEKPGIAFEIDIPEGEGGAHHKMAAGKGRMKTIHSAPLPLLRLLMSHLSLGNNQSERFSNPRHFVPELLCNHTCNSPPSAVSIPSASGFASDACRLPLVVWNDRNDH
jgi:hypothetical protein